MIRTADPPLDPGSNPGKRRWAITWGVACLLGVGHGISAPIGLSAAELRIGLSSMAISADPHARMAQPDYVLAEHVHDSLAGMDASSQPAPELATSWWMNENGDWVFRLRRDVRFQNGDEFTARDVIYSYCRVLGPPGTHHPRTDALADIELVTAPDPYTLVIHPHRAMPVFPALLAGIPIAAASPGAQPVYNPAGCADMPESAFDPGHRNVGSGPYRILSFSPQRVELQRNPNYWGAAPAWDRVELIRLADEERVHGLVQGRVDVIDAVPSGALAFLRRHAGLRIVVAPSDVLHYLQTNQFAEMPAGVDGTGGRNPFRDVRVRQAISHAIDRRLIVERIHGGHGLIATQLSRPGSGGYDPRIAGEDADRHKARRLLEEAGYGQGFDATILTVSSLRRSADVVAHLLRQIGLRVRVETASNREFWDRIAAGGFSLYYAGWVASPDSMPATYRALVGTPDTERRYGAHNYGGFRSAAIDALVAEAEQSLDAPRRDRLLRQAALLLSREGGIIPVMYGYGRWGIRANLQMTPRLDQMTLAADIRPLPESPAGLSGNGR